MCLSALAGGLVLAAVSPPYLLLIHGTTADEVERRLAMWLEVRPGTHCADLGAGDGTYAVALARTGQLVVPLRNPTRTRFITIVPHEEPYRDSLVAEHFVPFPFAMVPATRSAGAIRRAAGLCSTLTERPEDNSLFEDIAVFGN